MTNHNEGIDRRQDIATGLAACATLMAPKGAPAHVAAVVVERKLHGRHAFTLSNGHLSLSILSGGGFIGDVHLLSANPKLDINPMLVPEYQTIDPYSYNVVRDGTLYGTGVQRQLMSGYMGQFTCFPQFGHSADEFAATGYGQHGEAILVKWERQSSATGELTLAAHLPLNQYNFERTVVMMPNETVAYVTETAENLTGYDRPLQWVQHVTMGPPFAEIGKLWADASAAQVLAGRGQNVRQTSWGESVDSQGQPVDYRAFDGRSQIWLMQRSRGQNWITAYNENYNVLFGHVYDAAINPWVLDWQSDSHDDAFPTSGKVIARGFCWGDSPVGTGRMGAVSQGKYAGVSVYSWIGSRAKRSQRYAIFVAEIPASWRGVANVIPANGRIVIIERETGKSICLKAERI